MVLPSPVPVGCHQQRHPGTAVVRDYVTGKEKIATVYAVRRHHRGLCTQKQPGVKETPDVRGSPAVQGLASADCSNT